MPDFSDPVQIGRNLACLAGTVEGGAINVNVDGGGTGPSYGTTQQTVAIATDSTVNIPNGWSSWAATTLVSNEGNVIIAGAEVPPGISMGHGIQDGYPGQSFSITASGPNIAIVSYTESIPNP